MILFTHNDHKIAFGNHGRLNAIKSFIHTIESLIHIHELPIVVREAFIHAGGKSVNSIQHLIEALIGQGLFV
ncbi:MAG: hypothetical protein Q8R07_03005 [Candidatus Uhrbacteria bacterium]|nr:hypothetical protein [Candidatus Uhrbacteria bacterium]